ncbi:MAG: hypothetical protein LBC83_02515 [Oscillospiraceae bacterium]|nr:hypothetical protein [Oscillospiraceae bacterium]
MLNQASIQQLKQSNISKDAEKTKERVELHWKSANTKQKSAIKSLAGVAAQTVYRVCNTGSISIKIAIAFAQTLNINPYFFTGQTEEPGECTGAVLRDLLQEHGYRKLLMERDAAEKKLSRKLKAESEAAAEAETAPPPTESAAEKAETPAEAPVEIPMPEEAEMQVLLHALVIRAKLGVPDAVTTLAEVATLLLA